MTLIQIINKFYKKKDLYLFTKLLIKMKSYNFNLTILVSFIVFFSILFFIVTNLIAHKNKVNDNNFKEVLKKNEFLNLANYFSSKINSTYEEIKYVIKNNDSIEKILKNYNIKNEDIKEISIKLKEKKLSNIYSGRKLSLVYKKLQNNTNTVVNLVYPVNTVSYTHLTLPTTPYV